MFSILRSPNYMYPCACIYCDPSIFLYSILTIHKYKGNSNYPETFWSGED